MADRAYRFHTPDVFTDRRFGGNPLAVFPDAAGLASPDMQRIAREMNLSETAFVLPASDPRALCRVRIFTPGMELPFAGHPTIGTAFVLAALGRVPAVEPVSQVVFEQAVGLVPVRISSSKGQPVFAQLSVAALPAFGPPPPPVAALAAMLGIEPLQFAANDPVQAVSCGVPFLFVPVRDRQVLARVRLDVEQWRGTVAHSWASHVFVFCRDPQLQGSSVRARMFAPAMGIVEDPATGAAAAALGGYLAAREASTSGTLRWVIEQGFEMERPSLIDLEVDLRQGEVTAVRVGGGAVFVSEGTFRVDE